MKILLVLGESPVTGGAGIATYARHAIRAHREAGDDVHLFTWYFASSAAKLDQSAVPANSLTVLQLTREAVSKQFPHTPWTHALSHYLAPLIVDEVRRLRPDVIESSDFDAPLFGYLTRRRAGLIGDVQDIPVVTVNHGLSRPIYAHDANIPDLWERQNLAAERMALRWSDIVIAPSGAAAEVLRGQLGTLSQLHVVPEPYYFERLAPASSQLNRFVVPGRVAISKGIDRAVHFINIASTEIEPSEIVFIGRHNAIQYKTQSSIEFVLSRIRPTLRDRVNFTGQISPAAVLEQYHAGGVGLHFSRQETFNYSFLEQIDFGLVPVTASNTAMAEFYPPDLRHLLIPQNFTLSSMSQVLDTMKASQAQLEVIRDYAAERTKPGTFVEAYAQAVERQVVESQKPRCPGKFRGSDVTIFITAHNSTDAIYEALGSAQAQTFPPREIIVLDDGSTDPRSIEIIEGLRSQALTRVVRSEINEGLSASRQRLLALCTTDLCMFLDHDDKLDEKYVQRTVEVHNNSPLSPDAVITWRQNFGTENLLKIVYTLEDYETYLTNYAYLAAMFRTETMRAVGFVSEVRNGEADDWHFWLKFLARGFRAVCLPEPLFNYRVKSGSMSWPWSVGQAAGTANLLAPLMLDAVRFGLVPPDVIREALSEIHLDRFHANSARSQEHSLRGEFVAAAKAKHPMIGGVLSLVYRVVTSVARRMS